MGLGAMHPGSVAMPDCVFRLGRFDGTPRVMASTCQLCRNHPATTHLTELAPDGARQELHICPQCLREHGLDLTSPPPLAALTTPADATHEPATGEVRAAVCPACGLTFADYQQTNLLGCGACLAAFDRPFIELVLTHHGVKRHVGRVPHAAAEVAPVVRPRRPSRATLDKRLTAALAAEDYETAARLRDQLRAGEEQA